MNDEDAVVIRQLEQHIEAWHAAGHTVDDPLPVDLLACLRAIRATTYHYSFVTPPEGSYQARYCGQRIVEGKPLTLEGLGA